MWTEANFDIEIFCKKNEEAYKKVIKAMHDYTSSFEPDPDELIPAETQRVVYGTLNYLSEKGAAADTLNLAESGCVRISASMENGADELSGLFDMLLPILQKGSEVEESITDEYGAEKIPMCRTICYAAHKSKTENAVHVYPEENTDSTVSALISNLSSECFRNEHYIVSDNTSHKQFKAGELTDEIRALPVIGINAKNNDVVIHVSTK